MPRAIDIGFILRFILRRWPLLVIASVIAVAAGYILSPDVSAANTYSATAVVYCPGTVSAEIKAGIKTMTAKIQLITSEQVASQAVKLLSFDTTSESLRRNVAYSGRKNSAVYYISAFSARPERAVEMINAVADVFVREVSGDAGTAEVYEYADSARIRGGSGGQSSRRNLIAMMIFASPFAAAVLYLFVFNRARSVAEAVLYEQEDIFGVIPDGGKEKLQ